MSASLTQTLKTQQTPEVFFFPSFVHNICCVNLTDLGGNLGASDDGGEGPLGLLDSAREVVKLLLQQESGHGRGEELGHTLGGPVGAVGGSEGVVHEEVERPGQLLGEVCSILFRVCVGYVDEHKIVVHTWGAMDENAKRLKEEGGEGLRELCSWWEYSQTEFLGITLGVNDTVPGTNLYQLPILPPQPAVSMYKVTYSGRTALPS